MEADRYCIVFLDVSQVFDKIWIKVYFINKINKIKNSFPTDLYAIIESYLSALTFKVKYREVIT